MLILGTTQLTTESSIAFPPRQLMTGEERIDVLVKQRHVETRGLRMRGEFAQLTRGPNEAMALAAGTASIVPVRCAAALERR